MLRYASAYCFIAPRRAPKRVSPPRGYRWQKRLVKQRRLQAARRQQKLDDMRIDSYIRTRLRSALAEPGAQFMEQEAACPG
jgi:hypothetical protein